MPKIIEGLQEKLIKVSQEMLREKGYQAFNIREVAGRCSIATGTLYNYFPNKNALMVKLMIFHWEETYGELDRLEGERVDLYERLRVLYRRMSEFVQTFSDFWFDYSINVKRVEPADHRARFMGGLVDRVGTMIEDSPYEPVLPSEDIAALIVSNLLTMSQMEIMDYGIFESVLRKLLI